jgi:pimeloyl-ACP methyl ester carboxylesterase
MKPRWVLLRGLMRDARHWGGFPAVFADTLGCEAPLTLDLPGNGNLCGQSSPASVPAMAAWVRAELRRRGIAPPYRVLAMSLGAMVTVAWAAEASEDIDAAVLVNTSLKGHSRFYERLRPAAWPLLLRMALANPAPREVEASILRLTSRHAPDADGLITEWVRWREQSPVSRLNALRQLVAALRFTPPARPTVPLCLLVGLGDTLVNPRCSQNLARDWASPLFSHPSAGHDLPLDDPR